MIGIIDYGAGNISSVKNAFERVGEDAEPFSDPDNTENYSHLVLPGVGSFRMAMEQLNSAGWTKKIQQYAQSGRPLLGICLGMQLLFDEGDEDGPSKGLGLISGNVKIMNPDKPLKIPHVGWNRLYAMQDHPVMEGIKDYIDFYFVHSFEFYVHSKEEVIATTNHGKNIVSCIAKNNILGLQFHPEKSQIPGLKIIRNFIDWDPEI